MKTFAISTHLAHRFLASIQARNVIITQEDAKALVSLQKYFAKRLVFAIDETARQAQAAGATNVAIIDRNDMSRATGELFMRPFLPPGEAGEQLLAMYAGELLMWMRMHGSDAAFCQCTHVNSLLLINKSLIVSVRYPALMEPTPAP